MKELSTEERVDILSRIHEADNAQAEAMSCVGDYDRLDDDALFDLLGVSSWRDIPAGPWPEDEPAPQAKKKPGPKPGTKKTALGGGQSNE